MNSNCIFCKIADGSIPAEKVYEDDEFLAFRDLNPQAPIHVLLIPRKHYETVLDCDDPAFLGRCVRAACNAAKKLGISDSGFRLVINTNPNGGQTVYHIHIHILGGRFMNWPPG